MSNKKVPSIWERYLTKEIGIEFKACLYFFAILFFYCVYQIIGGVYVASILHMAEMIFTCYGICYLQVYAFANCDEAEELKTRQYVGIAVCILIYCLISYAGGWFDKSIFTTLLFASYLLLTYFCVYLIYKYKRVIDDKILNAELKMFQTEHKKEA